MIEMNFFTCYEYMRNHNVLMFYKGTVSQEKLVSLGEFVKESLFENRGEKKYINKVFAIFIEMSQNILRYSSERILTISGEKVGIGLIAVSEKEGKFTITSANKIEDSKKNDLEKRCNHINSLNEDELKEFYKEQRKNEKPAEKRGPGLGFIDIARKSRNKLNFKFETIGDDGMFFILSSDVEIDENTAG